MIDHIFQCYGQTIGGRGVGVVIAIRDGDEAHAHERENVLQVIAGLYIVPAKAREVLHYNTVGLAASDSLHHCLKTGPVKVGAGLSVIFKNAYELQSWSVRYVLPEQLLLVLQRLAVGAVPCFKDGQSGIPYSQISWSRLRARLGLYGHSGLPAVFRTNQVLA